MYVIWMTTMKKKIVRGPTITLLQALNPSQNLNILSRIDLNIPANIIKTIIVTLFQKKKNSQLIKH
jgi:hypothetical protein